MIYWIYRLLEPLLDDESIFDALINLLRYNTFRAGAAALTALGLTLFFGDRVIRKLISLKVGQPIRTAEEVHRLHELHGGKAGTPTMGGVLILGSVFVATLLWARLDNPFVWVVLLVGVGLGALGFADDYLKVVKKNSAGVNARTKLVVQCGVALTGAAILYFSGFHDPAGRTVEEVKQAGLPGVGVGEFFRQFHLPFFKGAIFPDIGLLAIVLMVLVVVASSNAVNLTDGLDGLASGCTVAVAMTYGAFCYLAGNFVVSSYLFMPFHPGIGELAVICLALVGACLGFLWFNCHPASVFMGDTGSLAIGGILGAVACCCHQEFLLVLVGGVFVMEAASVMIQVLVFKRTRRRVFRMAPIHHHFELGGWKEGKVIVRFWILSIIFAMLGLATLKLR